MKIRSCVLIFLSVTFTTIVIFLIGDSQFVFQSQGKINEWKNAKVYEDVSTDTDPAEKYLLKLGLYADTHLYPDHEWRNAALPIFVSAFCSHEAHLVPGFVKSFQAYLPNYTLLIYELDDNYLNPSVISSLCNSSSCAIRQFDFDSYPTHVQDLKLSAFRPIIIQEVLNQAGAVFWLDVEFVFTSSNIKLVLDKAEVEGLASWSINHPTSALTHPGMFAYFHTKQENYFFHRMIQPSHIVLYNTAIIHQQLMLSWVKCALVLDCIAPIGAQSTGCRFDKKPLFRYSGCHRYDMSALNVALGLMFDFTASRYVAPEEGKFFQHIKSEVKKHVLPKDSVKNATSLFSDISNTLE